MVDGFAMPAESRVGSRAADEPHPATSRPRVAIGRMRALIVRCENGIFRVSTAYDSH